MTDKELIQALRKAAIVITAETIGFDELKLKAADRLEALLAENERLKAQVPKWWPVRSRGRKP